MNKSRFICVVHSWFIESRGWIVVELDTTDRKQAEFEAAMLYLQHNKTFSQASVKVIEIKSGERLPELPRTLTIWERITGRIAAKVIA